MGLLDALFNSDTYGGQGGGILDLLRQTQAQNSAYQPSAGFPQDAPAPNFADRFNALPNAPQPFNPAPRQMDAANYDPATFAPNQAQPINIGGYQMPRLGSADLYKPQQVMTPPNAQPAQGQIPQGGMPQQQAPQQEEQLPPAFGGTSYLDRLNSGGGLIGSLLGDTNQQKNLRAQYDATRQMLMDSGVEERQAKSLAMAATLNPESPAVKTLMPELLTNKQDIKMVKDEFGAEHPYWYDKVNHTFKPALTQGGAGAGSGGGPGLQQVISSLDNMPAGSTQEQRLAQVPESYRGYVKSLLEGKALPSNIGRSQLRGPLITLAHAVDGSFDESLIPLRFKTATDYAPNGQSGRSIVALNTVQHHIGKLSDDLENLGDTGWTAGNAVWNAIAKNTPMSPGQGKAIQAVQDDIKAVTDEMSAAYKAGRVSDHEIESWNKLANSNLPLRQLKQGIYDFVGLLNGKRDQLNETHQSILGKDAPGMNKDLNEAITKKVISRNSGDAAPTPATQGAPAPGAYVWSPGKGISPK